MRKTRETDSRLINHLEIIMNDAIRDLPTRELLSIITRNEVCDEDMQRPLLQMLKTPSRNDYPIALLVAGELAQRALADQLHERSAMTNPEMVRAYLQLHFGAHEHEAFVVLHLTSHHMLIEAEELFRGTLTQTTVFPREVVKSALRRNSAAVIFAHNHPSGSCEASHADKNLTQCLKTALALVDVTVLDHIIVSGTSCLSLSEMGYM